MNLIDNKNTEKLIEFFFDKYIVNDQEKKYFVVKPNEEIESYYSKPQHKAFLYHNFSSFDNVDSLRKYLLAFFEEIDSMAVLNKEMSEDISQIAYSLKNIVKKNDEISPFIYAMY